MEKQTLTKEKLEEWFRNESFKAKSDETYIVVLIEGNFYIRIRDGKTNAAHVHIAYEDIKKCEEEKGILRCMGCKEPVPEQMAMMVKLMRSNL